MIQAHEGFDTPALEGQEEKPLWRNSQITGAWVWVMKAIWENISGKPVMHRDKEREGDAHSDLQNSVTTAITVKEALTYMAFVS